MIPALGWGCRPTATRSRSRRAAFRRSQAVQAPAPEPPVDRGPRRILVRELPPLRTRSGRRRRSPSRISRSGQRRGRPRGGRRRQIRLRGRRIRRRRGRWDRVVVPCQTAPQTAAPTPFLTQPLVLQRHFARTGQRRSISCSSRRGMGTRNGHHTRYHRSSRRLSSSQIRSVAVVLVPCYS